MRYPLNLPELPGRKIELELPGIFSGARILVDGQPAAKGPKRRQFLIRGSDAGDSVITLKPSLDPIPKVLWAGRTINVVKPLTWYQWVWIGVPLLLVVRGGALGGALGGAAMILNARILRSEMGVMPRYGFTAILTLGAVGAYIFLASLLVSAIHGL